MSHRARLVLILVAVVLGAIVAVLVARPLLLRAEVRAAIVAYDDALIESEAKLTTAPLKRVASGEEVQRVQNVLAGLLARKVVLDGTLERLEIGDVASAEPTVTVRVVERWSYAEKDFDTGEQLGGATRVTDRLLYTLVREDGRLIVFSCVAETDQEQQ